MMLKMKKTLCLLLCLLLVPALALAQEGESTANGVVKSAKTYEVVAPYSGVLLSFDWETGDAVGAEDVLFTLDTNKVYAPESGTVTSLFVRNGELCEDAMAQYGMVAAIEKAVPLVVKASTKNAYNDSANLVPHMGAKVYFEAKSGDAKGEGVIVSVDGESYTVEVTQGEDFDPDDTVKLYRDEDRSSKKCVGEGDVARAKDVTVSAAGRVIKCYVHAGERVAKGQLLLELAASDAENGLISASVTAGHDGALSAVKVACGQQVYKGQSLATVSDLSELSVIAEVDEIDLNSAKVGDSLKIIFDRYPNEELQGTVKTVSRVGFSKQNAAYYNVELSVMTALEVLPGMSVTVYLPAAQN